MTRASKDSKYPCQSLLCLIESIQFIIEKRKRQGLAGGEGIPGPLNGSQRATHIVWGNADQNGAAVSRRQLYEHGLNRLVQLARVEILDNANNRTLSRPEFKQRFAGLLAL